eukprot:scaffold22634_cov123-Cylindrotheca_fusiformis.AAC.4
MRIIGSFQLLVGFVIVAVFSNIEDTTTTTTSICCTGFLQEVSPTQTRLAQNVPRRGNPSISIFMAANNENNNDDDDNNKKEKDPKKNSEPPISLYELSRREEEASKRVRDKLLFPYRLGRAFNALLWTFVVVGVLLNVFGYGYIRGDNGMLSIGTLEERNFQIEVNKSAKEAMQNAEKETTTTTTNTE